MRAHHLKVASLCLVCAALLSTAACVDEEVVERELFREIPRLAGNFVGYGEHASKLTTCGNCHVEKQADWRGTAHADAWADLQGSGHAETFCEGCHTVNELGNTATDPAGYNTTRDERYEDVQCEACHGPGLDHVLNPSKSTAPLAAATVGIDNTAGCGECHQGTHHPFVEQWEQSRHAQVNAFAAGEPECAGCHSGGGALARWGINTNYLELGETFEITCVVCHDPHAKDNDRQTRFPVGGVAIEATLCVQCHDRRSIPEPGSSQGLYPHAPAAGMLRGDVGWLPPNVASEPGQFLSTHGSERNERLCATCHVNFQTLTDQATGEFLLESVGHTFNAIPCLDGDGFPTTADCALSDGPRSFDGCTGSGCHGSEAVAYTALRTATATLEFWADELDGLLRQIDPNLAGTGGEIDGTDNRFTAAEGAFFNLQLARFGGAERADPLLRYAAAAAHNPFLSEQLLISSIQALRDQYGVSLSSSELALTPRLGHAGK